MTTETTQRGRARPRPAGAGALAAAAAASLGVGAALAIAGGVLAGSSAALGALVGTVLAVAVFSLGSFAVDAVARLMPTASLLVAMLTYTLQVVLMWLVFVALARSGMLGDTLAAGWLAAGVIAATAVWLGAQLLLATRARIPVYDLPAHPPEAGAR